MIEALAAITFLIFLIGVGVVGHQLGKENAAREQSEAQETKEMIQLDERHIADHNEMA